MTTSQPAPGGQLPVGQPDAFGPPPGGQPAAPKRSKLAWLKFAIPVIVVVLVAGGYAISYFTGTVNAQPGDCLTVTEFSKAADEPTKADCGAQEANVKIAARVGGDESCPEGDYDTISMTGRMSYKLCLTVNAKQGDCLAGFLSNTAGYKKVSCADPAKDAELVKITDTVDKAVCEGTEATHAQSYSTPPTTVCVKAGK
ncbi:hypothetical protein [Amycolatopsis sp. NPDC051071]|uniref:LppU/SCO3897 family protein n=1 Tax=Amycolatopsis sp. NPDC051071 TaxID=3154637 RepID=UPI00341E7D9E